MPLGMSATMPSPSFSPRSRSACTIWLTRPSRSPALCSVPSGSMTAIQSGLSCARCQNPTSSLRNASSGLAGLGGRADWLVLVLVLLILRAHPAQHQADDQQDDADQAGCDRDDEGGEVDQAPVVVVALHGGRDAVGR